MLAHFVVCKMCFNKADPKENTELTLEEVLVLTTTAESLQWVRGSMRSLLSQTRELILKDTKQHFLGHTSGK